MTQPYTIHPLAWLAWLVAVLIALTTTRNPFYVGLILLWVATVSWSVRADPTLPVRPLSLPFSFARFGSVIVLASTLFNALTVHVGNTILGRLPQTIPLLGGTITLEAAVYGALNGCVLVGVLMAFLLVNQVVPVRALIQLIPRAYYPLAVVVAIALSFVPVTLRQFQQVREAQAVRGHRVRGLRDWLPLLIPLLIGGLERALQLAEAMMARGFASEGEANPTAQKNALLPLAQVGGLLILITGWLLRLVWQQNGLGLVLMLMGGASVALTLWRVGRRHPHTVYRPTSWRWPDGAIGLSAAIMVILFLSPLPSTIRASLFYYPYPTLTWPVLAPLFGLATLGLLAPAVFIYDVRCTIDTGARRIVRQSKIQNPKSKIEPL